jgi:hypothetical protein
LLATVAHNVSAATPPEVAPGQVAIQIPQLRETITINLREIRALTGSPPINVLRPEILLNGEPAGLAVTVIETSPGSVCLQIENGNFVPPVEGPLEYSLSFGASNPNFPEPVFLTTRIQNVQGPTTNPQSPACADPNTPPVANPGRTASQFAEDESIVLDGSASTERRHDSHLYLGRACYRISADAGTPSDNQPAPAGNLHVRPASPRRFVSGQ